MKRVIGKSALKRNPALKSFEVLIGKWKTVGSHPYLPGKELRGYTSFEWGEGGAFVIVRTEISNESRIPNGISIIGSDDEAKKLYMIYFDSRGISRKYDVSMTKTQLKWSREGKKLSQKFTLKISEDGDILSSKGIMSQAGKKWEKDLSLTYKRVK